MIKAIVILIKMDWIIQKKELRLWYRYRIVGCSDIYLNGMQKIIFRMKKEREELANALNL